MRYHTHTHTHPVDNITPINHMNAKSRYFEVHLFSKIQCSVTNDLACLNAYQQEFPVSDRKYQVTYLIQIEMSNTHANEHLELL